MEWCGRNVVTMDKLLGMLLWKLCVSTYTHIHIDIVLDDLCDVLDVPPELLASTMLPHALPRLVSSQSDEALESIAQHCSTTVAALLKQHLHHVIASALYNGTDQFSSELAFIERFLPDALKLACANVKEIVMALIQEACQSDMWSIADTAVPPPVYDRTQTMLRMAVSMTRSAQGGDGGPASPSVERFLAGTHAALVCVKWDLVVFAACYVVGHACAHVP